MLNQPARRALSPGPVYYGLAFVFFVVVFGIIPFSIYAHSGDDWGFPYYQTLYISVLGLATFIVIRLIALVHVGTAAGIACALFCLGAFLLLAHVYAPIQIGPLDGSEIESDEPLRYTLVEIGLLAVALVAFFQLRRGRGLTVATLFSLALTLVGVGYVGALAFAEREKLSATETPAAQEALTPTRGSAEIQGNVYHIVLDAMQTDAFVLALERAARAGSFEGFQLFENNVSNYITTVPSSASYLSGSFYKGGDFDVWARQARSSRGLFAALSGRDYQVWMYAPFAYWQSRYIDHFRHNVGIYEEEIGLAPAGLYDLLHIWLASLAPNPLTDEALSDVEGLRDWLFELVTEKPRPLSIQQGLHPYSGAMMLRRLVREEELRAPDGQYVYAHAALPHAPWVFDRDCRYVGNPGAGRRDPVQRREAYLGQAECAVTLVAEFLESLKRLRRYDSSMVVVHADHGQRIRFADGARDSRTLDTPDVTLLSSVNALLMIKRPHAKGPLEIKETPTQLVDLFPTILDILDLEAAHDPSGKSVYSIRDDEQREARFGFDPARKHGHNLVEVRIEDQTDLPNSNLTVLGPATDPATWRDQVDGAVTGGRPDVASRNEPR